jgi:hypothetical protein
MSEHDKKPPPEKLNPFSNPLEVRKHWGRERREKIVQEILANRRGEYQVPTWVLGLCLAAMIAVILGVLILY